MKYSGFTGYNPALKENARNLRRNLTKQERHLWYDFLRSYPVKIYRQRVIDRFIVDFYCSKAKLVIEIDGAQHFTENGHEYDAERTLILKQYGLEVLRFSNADIDTHFDAVCTQIDRVIHARISALV